VFKYYFLFFALIFIACGEKNAPANPDSSQEFKGEYEAVIKKHDGTVKAIDNDILERFMYVNGYRTGINMKNDRLFLNVDHFIQGYIDALKDAKPLIPTDSMDAIVNDFSAFMTQRMDSIMKLKEIEASVLAVKNLSESEEFLEKNASKPGVVALPSTLQYKVIKEGTGRIPSTTDYILVHMTSSFPDGTIFDDTRSIKPRMIPNEKMFPAWLEGITKMKEGSHFILYIPPALAFGEQGVVGKVPSNKLTIADVEFIKILTPEEVNEYMKENPPPKPVIGGPIQNTLPGNQ